MFDYKKRCRLMKSFRNIMKINMNFDSLLLLLPLLFQALIVYSSTPTDILSQGSSLSVKRATTDVLVSQNGIFSAGFIPVGENAFSFAVWFTISSDPTIVWMANRDQPVNGRDSKLSLTKTGNLVLLDAGRVTIWSTGTSNMSAVKLQLEDTGNLVLRTTKLGKSFTLWESFKFPTNTLLPKQTLTVDTKLVSSKSQTNYSSGYYELFWDDDNVLRLRFYGLDPQISSVYWPPPWQGPFENGRTTYNNSKNAALSSTGVFSSSDDLSFIATDYGVELHRRLTLDSDGNLRLYSFDMNTRTWIVTWQALPEPCKIHGTCGPNSFCSYDHRFGRRCSCLPGFKMKKYPNWLYGCEPEVKWNNSKETDGFVRIANAEFYGYDRDYFPNQTLNKCEEICLSFPECKGFQFKYEDSIYKCFPKARLLNGLRMSGFEGDVYIRVPKANISVYHEKPNVKEIELDCHPKQVILMRAYKKPHENATLKVLVCVSIGLAGVEFVCVIVVMCFLQLSRNRNDSKMHGYMLAATRFREFTYNELRKATRGFREEIGSGAGGTVFKGVLSDGRVAAIKRLREAHQGEAEFLAEVRTIWRLNHMNLIEMWGYCIEGKHRLLVYEYMKHGSLAHNLSSNALDWEKRFSIALGTSKGLAYLHEECLEWVLHCDVKPQNILLDSDYQAKVADFGLSKLQKRGESHNSSFSRIRGTRGYMAPDWVYNLPITSKVDVYSYGIVALELVTGRKPTSVQIVIDGGGTTKHGRLVTWVREKMNRASTTQAWMEEIADPILEGKFDRAKMELLVKVALQCVEEDKKTRPTMRQVVEMIQCHDECSI